jgi:hypothetical protein
MTISASAWWNSDASVPEVVVTVMAVEDPTGAVQSAACPSTVGESARDCQSLRV